MEILTSLFDYKVKRHSLILAIIFLVLDKVIYANFLGSSTYFNHIFFNYIIVVGLLTAINCKDKVDDERSMMLRYGILKNTIGIFVVFFGIIALFSGNSFVADKNLIPQSLSMLTILYFIEGILTLHIILYYLANKYNPSWLFKEKTVNDSRIKFH